MRIIVWKLATNFHSTAAYWLQSFTQLLKLLCVLAANFHLTTAYRLLTFTQLLQLLCVLRPVAPALRTIRYACQKSL